MMFPSGYNLKSPIELLILLTIGKEEGIHGFAIDLVSFDEKFKKIFSYVFGNTLVIEDIDIARKIGIGKARMVTLDGDMAEVSGAMQGGFRKIKGTGFKENEVFLPRRLLFLVCCNGFISSIFSSSNSVSIFLLLFLANFIPQTCKGNSCLKIFLFYLRAK